MEIWQIDSIISSHLLKHNFNNILSENDKIDYLKKMFNWFWCLYQQEVFESRFQKILQEPEGCSMSLQCVDNQKGSLLTSESSENKSSSESEGSSNMVSMQLSHLEEKVGITHIQCICVFTKFSECWLLSNLMVVFSVESYQRAAKETHPRTFAET